MRWLRSETLFRTAKSGSWNDRTTWEYQCKSGHWHKAPNFPSKDNDVYIEPNHAITLSANASCKSLYIHSTEVFTKLNTGIYNLQFYGFIAQYTGSISDGSFTLGRINNSASEFWIKGTLVAKGKSRNITTGSTGSYMWGQAAQAGGFTFSIELDDNNQVFYFPNTPSLSAASSFTLGGNLIIVTGILRVDYNCGFRLLENTLTEASGLVTIKSDASLILGAIMYRSASLNLTKIEVEPGGNFIQSDRNTRTIAVTADTILMNGNHIIDTSFSLETGGSNISLLIATVPTYSNLILKQTGEVRLTRNINIVDKLSIQSETATINKQSFSLNYDVNADLEYKITRTSGLEFVTSGSGASVPRNLIVDGCVLTLNGNKAVRENIILLNGGSINYNGFTITLPTFRTVQSGNFESLSTWNTFNSFSSSGFAASIIPNSTHDVYVEANHTLTLNSDNSCKSLAINSTEDVTRLNLNNFTLNVNNQLDLYTGSASSPTYGAPVAPVGSTMLYNNGGSNGRIKFVGTGTRTLLQLGRVGANIRQAGLRIEIDATGTNTWQQYRLGNLIVSSGDTQTTLSANVRLDATGVTGQINGDLLIKTGAKFDGGIGITRLTGSTNLVNSVNIESGGELYFRNVTGTAVEMSVSTYSFLGRVSYVAAGIQTTALSSNTGAAFLSSSTITNNELYFGGSGAKTLSNNQFINGKLILADTASITLNSKTITFGSNGNLEILTSRTRGSELIISTSEIGMPNNLIIPTGVVYDLGGVTVNIRGVLQGGGSVTNGTLVQNYFSTVDMKSTMSGAYTSPSTWQIFTGGSWIQSVYTTPSANNSIYLESGFTVSQTSNVECKDLHVNTTVDVIRLNNNGYIVDIWGKLRVYSGTAPGTSDGVGAGTLGYLGMGTLRFRGTSRTGIAFGEFSANANNIHTTMEVALDNGQTLIILATIRFGYFIITSGAVEQDTNRDIRLAGDGSVLDSANMQGVLTIKSGTILKGGLAVQRAATSAMKTMTLEVGGILWITKKSYFIGAQTLNLLGEVIMDVSGTVPLPNNTSRSFASSIDTYSILTLQNTGNYSLQFNTTVNTKLTRKDTAQLTLNSKTLTYGSMADLEYVGTFTSDVEFPNGTSGLSMPRNLIVDGGILTLNSNKTIRGSVILKNGGSINLNGFILTAPIIVSATSGNYESVTSWNLLDPISSNLIPSTVIPTLYNDVYIEAGHTITLTQNNSCKTLNLNATQDVVRINTSIYELSLWGTFKSYDGTYSSNTFNLSNAGIAGWITGTIVFTGSTSRTIMGPGQTITANARAAGWNMIIDFPSNATATHDTAVTRCGNLTVRSGTLSLLPINGTGNEIRVAGMDFSAQPGDGTNAGNVLVKSGAKLINNGRLIKNTPTSAKNGIQNLTVESGGIYVSTLAAGTVPTVSYSLLGEVWFNQLYAQNFLDKSTNVDSVDITNYSTVLIGGSGTKTLRANTVISTKLSFAEVAATLVLSTFTLNYGTNGNLEYTVSRTKGVELINSGSGFAIPKDIILGTGVVLNLGGGTVNIRGTLTLGAGASITNGTLNQNQP